MNAILKQWHPDRIVDTNETARVINLYSVNGLNEGETDWLGAVLPGFVDRTGFTVRYFEDHSRRIVERMRTAMPEDAADVIITLPPFVQMASRDGLLRPFSPQGAASLAANERGPNGEFHLLLRDYPTLVYNKTLLDPPPDSYTDLLSGRFHGKIQYSKPGWSGAGTAFLLQVIRAFSGEAEALAYLRDLQRNCLPHAAHTQGLGEQVDSGELLLANGDLQTNYPQLADNPNLAILFPRGPQGRREAFELSYYIGLGTAARNEAGGKALIEHLLSPEAQVKASAEGQGLPARRDVKPQDAIYQELSAMLADVEIWDPDWLDIAQRLDRMVAEFDAIVLGSIDA